MTDEYTPEAWRMTGYYPESYAKFMSMLGIGLDYDDDEFERYEAQFTADLAAYTVEVQAAALREAADSTEKWVDPFSVGGFRDFLRARADSLHPVTPETKEEL